MTFSRFRPSVTTAVFAITSFLAAALLFSVQPMAAKLLLPRFGGAPAVWTACLLFFQAMLLLGYGATDALRRCLSPFSHALVQLGLMLVAALTLPSALPADGITGVREPIGLALWSLTALIGAPFLVLAMMAPLLQRLLVSSASSTPQAQESLGVYRLYAASNAGSLMALVAYPLVIEPWFPLSWQTIGWAMGFAVVWLLTAACWELTRRDRQNALPVLTTQPATALFWTERAIWVGLSFVPSSLMAACSTFLTTWILPAPLLWALPLALYLLTFILAFAWARLGRMTAIVETLAGVGIVGALWSASSRGEWPTLGLVAGHLATLFLCGLVCHIRLAQGRPAQERLTEFYVWLAVGGALGGLFNSVCAPNVFPTLVEYPISLVLAGVVVGMPRVIQWSAEWRWMLFSVFTTGAVAAIVGNIPTAQAADRGYLWLLAFVPAWLTVFWRKALAGAAALAVATAAAGVADDLTSHVVFRTRTFFGVYRVSEGKSGRTVVLDHGSIQHGLQLRDADVRVRRIPLGYYFPTGPIGQVLAGRASPAPIRVGVVGLGVGALAGYGRPHDQFDFFEIDPVVAAIARDSGYFTYLRDTAAECRVILGDARLTLERQPDAAYDLLVLDAFTGDSVPAHLLTEEVFRLYARKLKPAGAVALHLSSQYVNLAPVVAAGAERLNWDWRVQVDRQITDEDFRRGKRASMWAAMGPTFDEWPQIGASPRWLRPESLPRTRWTDDQSSIASVWRGTARKWP